MIIFWISSIKNWWNIVFFSLYISTYIISLIWPPDLQSLSYLLSGLLQKGYADSCASCVTLGKLLLQSLFPHLQNGDGAYFIGLSWRIKRELMLNSCHVWRASVDIRSFLWTVSNGRFLKGCWRQREGKWGPGGVGSVLTHLRDTASGGMIASRVRPAPELWTLALTAVQIPTTCMALQHHFPHEIQWCVTKKWK